MASHSQIDCPTCNRKTLAVSDGANHGLHFVLSILTAGLWLPMWLLLALTSSHPRCTVCGSQEKRTWDDIICRVAVVATVAVVVAAPFVVAIARAGR